MTKTHRGLILVGMAALALACDGDGQTTSGSGLDGDCPIGMFRPVGLTDCVFPADDSNGNPLTTADDRCAVGQPVVPPSCVGLEGERPYLSASMACASGYRFEPGVCNRDTSGFGGFQGTTGAAGDISTGGAGTTGAAGFGGGFGGFDGASMAGAPGSGNPGAAGAISATGATGEAGTTDEAGAAGSAGQTGSDGQAGAGGDPLL
jgi:hypothetical protein